MTASDLVLTRVMFAGTDRRARRVLASRERLHALVETALDAGGSDKMSARRLWRLDRVSHGMVLYILADRAPLAVMLQTQLGECRVESKPYGPFLNSLSEGEMLRLTVTANATHTVGGRRVPVPVADREMWLRKRLNEAGCSVVAVHDTGSEDWHFSRSGRTVTLRVVRFEATIRVSNPGNVRTLLTDGLGKAKGYGLGMVCPSRV